ncbi:MAG TPA: HAD family acid phosphatase [Alphaproteobacteria bacterium]|nr:HAD family acid phosphatase [Alphaproteobacteria bacterium]
MPLRFRILVALIFALSAAPAFGTVALTEPELRAYHTSGDYANDLATADAEALAYIKAYAGDAAKPALVLDIDETALSNMPLIVANNYAGNSGMPAWQAKAKDEAIAPTLDIFRAAQAKGMAVFFITGRDESLREATEKNLKAAGYSGWKELIMRPAGSSTPSAADYKAPQRARIEGMGYTIIACIGDQASDLAGGHALRSFQLPNPFYFIP